MAMTDSELARLTAIETMLNNIMTAIENLASKQMMRQLTLLKQQEIVSLQTKVNELEAIITLLEKSL